MGVASGCGEQEVGVASGSGWNLWLWLLGVVLRRYIDFLILLIPTPLVSVLFCSSIPTSFFILLKYIHRLSKRPSLLTKLVQGDWLYFFTVTVHKNNTFSILNIFFLFISHIFFYFLPPSLFLHPAYLHKQLTT